MCVAISAPGSTDPAKYLDFWRLGCNSKTERSSSSLWDCLTALGSVASLWFSHILSTYPVPACASIYSSLILIASSQHLYLVPATSCCWFSAPKVRSAWLGQPPVILPHSKVTSMSLIQELPGCHKEMAISGKTSTAPMQDCFMAKKKTIHKQKVAQPALRQQYRHSHEGEDRHSLSSQLPQRPWLHAGCPQEQEMDANNSHSTWG